MNHSWTHKTLHRALSVTSRPTICQTLPFRSQRSLRHQSTEVLVAESGIAALSNRALIHVSGRDAPKFLQGLTTNNVDVTQQQGSYTAFLTATGRVMIDAFLWPTWNKADGEWACVLDVEASEITKRLESYLKKHKLRSKVNIKRLEGFNVWTAWMQGPESQEHGYRMPELENQQSKTWAHLPDSRIPGFSHRFILPSGSSSNDSALGLPDTFAGLSSASQQQYDLRRFLNGVPEGSTEMYSEHYQAHPSNLDILNAVDFHKGCYVGQELTIRTEHTGVVRKRILPAQLYPSDSSSPTSLSYAPNPLHSSADTSPISFETKILSAGGKREAGKWIAGMGNVGLAMCRLETMTDLKVSAEGGTYSENAEFFIHPEVASGLKVKAFVPDWLRERLSSKPRKPRG